MHNFLIDHNVPKSVADFLRKEKQNVKMVKDVDPSMTDLQVMSLARKEDRIVISNDTDFISLSTKFLEVDVILFSYLDQSPEIRIYGLKKILPNLKEGFGILILQ